MSDRVFPRATRAAAGYADVTPEEVAARPDAVRVIDVREPGEYAGELGHIPASELVPLATVADRATRWAKDDALVIVCRSGGRSAQAAALLAHLGFSRVFNMVGGMAGYAARGLPSER